MGNLDQSVEKGQNNSTVEQQRLERENRRELVMIMDHYRQKIGLGEWECILKGSKGWDKIRLQG